jgi:hypothetical protein
MPQRLPPLLVRRIRADQARDDGAADFAAVHIAPVQEVEVVIGIDMRAGLQPDDGAETFGVLERQVQRDTTPIEQPIRIDRSSPSAAEISTPSSCIELT